MSKPISIQEDQFQIKDPGNQSGCQNRVEINLKRDLGQVKEEIKSRKSGDQFSIKDDVKARMRLVQGSGQVKEEISHR